jgi:hypothetical protein
VTVDDLTPGEREEVQRHYVRTWFARRRRMAFARVRTDPPNKQYDMSGRLVAIDGQPCPPRVSSFADDRPPR